MRFQDDHFSFDLVSNTLIKNTLQLDIFYQQAGHFLRNAAAGFPVLAEYTESRLHQGEDHE
jgi:hypothetical protein